MTSRIVLVITSHITHHALHITYHRSSVTLQTLQHLPCCSVQMLPGDCKPLHCTELPARLLPALQLASVTTLAPLPASGHQRNYTQPLYTATIMHALIVVMTNVINSMIAFIHFIRTLGGVSALTIRCLVFRSNRISSLYVVRKV